MNLFTKSDTRHFDSSYVTVGSYKIFERRSRTDFKDTVLLIHGINVSEKYYRPLAFKLQKKYNVLSIDLPGYGESDKRKDALTLDQLAKVVASYIQLQPKKSVYLIGQSMGTQICVKVAALFPSTVQKMILLAPTINQSERNIFVQILRLMQDTLREPPIVTLIIILDFFRFGVIRFLKTQKFMIDDKIEETIKTISLETLFVCGGKDPIATPSWTSSLAEYAKNAQFISLENAPHNFQFTHANELQRICDSFLKR